MSLRNLERRLKRLETARKPRPSPIVIAYGTFDAFAMQAYLDVEAGTLSGEFLFIVDAMRLWELPGGAWDTAYAHAG
jgi:hypothetical protein